MCDILLDLNAGLCRVQVTDVYTRCTNNNYKLERFHGKFIQRQ